MQKKTESPRFRVNIGLVKSAYELLGQMLADGDERARFADQWGRLGFGLQIAEEKPPHAMMSIPVPEEFVRQLDGRGVFVCAISRDEPDPG